jgi:hypothetical protein
MLSPSSTLMAALRWFIPSLKTPLGRGPTPTDETAAGTVVFGWHAMQQVVAQACSTLQRPGRSHETYQHLEEWVSLYTTR